jgi:hypothetical protein
MKVLEHPIQKLKLIFREAGLALVLIVAILAFEG